MSSLDMRKTHICPNMLPGIIESKNKCKLYDSPSLPLEVISLNTSDYTSQR